MINEMKEFEVQLEDQIINIVYFMKGGIEWDMAWSLSFKEREHIVKILNKRLRELSGDPGNLINNGDI